MASERRAAAFSNVDFGQRLRTAREKRGASLRAIAESTKISINILEALEANDVRRLPGGIFTRSFVKAYAVQVGLDPDETLLEFQRAFPDHAPAPDRVPVDLEPGPAAPDGRLWPLVVVAAVIVALAAAGTAWYRGWRPGWLPAPLGSRQVAAGAMQPATPALPPSDGAQAGTPPTTVAPSNDAVPPTSPDPASPAGLGTTPGQPAPGTATGSAPPTPGTDTTANPAAPGGGPPPAAGAVPMPPSSPPGPPPSTTSVVATRPESATVPGAVAPETGDDAQSSGRSPLRLTVQPTAPCWVKVSADGTVQVARLVQPGERLEFEAATVLQVEAGDAGAFAYLIGGKPGRPLGKPGRVARVRIDRTNAVSFVTP